MKPTGEEVVARLREASRLSDLRVETRLHGKLDMSPAGIAARLREASDLLALCMRLQQRGDPPRG